MSNNKLFGYITHVFDENYDKLFFLYYINDANCKFVTYNTLNRFSNDLKIKDQSISMKIENLL